MNATTKVTVVVPFELPAFGDQGGNYRSKVGTARDFALTQAFLAVPGSVEAYGPKADEVVVVNVPVAGPRHYRVLAYEATFTFNVVNPR